MGSRLDEALLAAVTGSLENGTKVRVDIASGVALSADSEFPAADVGGDAKADPTTTSVKALAHGYNGATWDRLRATIAGGLAIGTPTGIGTKLAAASLSVTTASDEVVPLGQAAMAASMPVTIASNQSAVPVNTKTALTPAAATAVSVGVASGLAVAANASRKGLILVNTSTARISLGLAGAAAVLDSGITIMASGSYNMGEYDFNTGAIAAIASAAASNLSVQEFS